MRPSLLALLATLSGFTVVAHAAEPPRQYEVRDFFRNPERSRFSLSPDGKTLAFLQPVEQRLNVFIQSLDAQGKPQGEPKQLTSETARDVSGYLWKGNARLLYVKDFGGGYDVEGLSYSRLRKKIEFFSVTTWKGERSFVDDAAKQRFAAVEKQLPGYEILMQSHSKDETRWIVATYNDRTQGARYLYDTKSGALHKLADIAPWLPESDMAPMKPITYTSRDGLTIQGYLTLPVGRAPKALPVVVNPHGGPWYRDVWGFNPEVQLLANRGYGFQNEENQFEFYEAMARFLEKHVPPKPQEG